MRKNNRTTCFAVAGIIGLLFFAGCANQNQEQDGSRAVVETVVGVEEPQAYDVHEPRAERPRHHTNHILNIAQATDSLLATFERIHEFDYSQLRGGFNGGYRIAIWTYQPVYNFEVVNIVNDAVGDEIVFYHISTYGTIDTLVPGQVFVINNYIGLGTIPHSAVAFTDQDGMRFYFAIVRDESDSPYTFLFWAIWPLADR